MGYYNVIQAGWIPGKGHYTNLPNQPVEVDDEVAAPLVEAGSLTPYRPAGVSGKTGTVLDGVLVEPLTGLMPPWHASEPLSDPLNTEGGEAVRAAAGDRPKPPRSRRKSDSDDAA